MARILSISDAADFFGYSRQSISNFIKEEGAPVVSQTGQGKTGEIDSVEFHRWLCMRNTGDGSALEKARLGKTQEEERKLQIENDTKMGQLCPVADVVVLYSETLVIIRTSMEGLPGRLAGGNKALRQKWLNEIRSTLNAATDRIQQFVRERAASASPDADASRPSELEVGEGKQSPAKGRSRARAVPAGKNAVGDRNKRSVPSPVVKKRDSSARPADVKNRRRPV